MLRLRAAFLATLAFFASAVAAYAVEAASTTWLNVRSGPGTSYGIVDTLSPGEVVDVTECEANGWCYIQHPGPDGWVSSSYLTAAPAPGAEAPSPDCRLVFTIGPDGPSLSVVCGDGPGIPAPPPPAAVDQACFYVNQNYGGQRFCIGVGTINALNTTFNDRISSVRLEGAARARLCVNTHLGGYCRTVLNDSPALGPLIDNKASSVAVYTGTWPGPPTPLPMPMPMPTPLPLIPSTHSTGLIDLQQTYTANLDNGAVGGPGVDIWYRAVNPVLKYIAPRNGAQLARGDGSNRGYAGCAAETFTSSQIPLPALPVGTYVCVRTNQGRISQFRVNGFVGTTMKIGYTTWSN